MIARDYKVPGVSVGDWRDESTFTAVELPADVGDRAPLALHALTEHEIIAVGEDGLILRGGRDGWTVEPSGVTEDLLEVWGSDSDGFYAVGEQGRILFRGEQGWRVVDSGTDQTLRSIHGQPGGRIVIGGDGSALLEVIAR